MDLYYTWIHIGRPRLPGTPGSCVYQNELDKACFQRDMAYADFKDLPRKTVSEKVLRDAALNIVKIENMIDTNVALLRYLQFFW